MLAFIDLRARASAASVAVRPPWGSRGWPTQLGPPTVISERALGEGARRADGARCWRQQFSRVPRCPSLPRPRRASRALTRASQVLGAAVLARCELSAVVISKLQRNDPEAGPRTPRTANLSLPQTTATRHVLASRQAQPTHLCGACHSLPYKCLRASSLVNSSSSTMPGSRLW